MPFSTGAGQPMVTLDETALENAASTYLAAQGVTSDAAWTTFVNGRTDAQIVALFKQLLIKWIRVVP